MNHEHGRDLQKVLLGLYHCGELEEHGVIVV